MNLFTGFFGGQIQEGQTYKDKATKYIEKHQTGINVIRHDFFPFANRTLKIQNEIEPTIPDSTTNQLAFSSPKTKGMTKVAKNTWPIPWLISDKALNCGLVNSVICTSGDNNHDTGSLRVISFSLRESEGRLTQASVK